MTAHELRRVRERLGLTQQGLADALGVSQSAVSQMESGATRITRRTKVQVQAIERQSQKGEP